MLQQGYDLKELTTKWGAVLESEYAPKIKDKRREAITAIVLENTLRACREESYQMRGNSTLFETANPMSVNRMGASSSTASDGAIDTFDPVLISLVRRAMPNLISYDIMGVQPMTGPTGLIFAQRSRYANQAGDETFYNEVNTAFSSVVSGANTLGLKHTGSVPDVANNAANGAYNYAGGMATAQAEALGTTSNSEFAEMSMSIEKVSVTAKSRALRATYTMELAQDLRAIHGLDAESELSRILSSELIAEINREAVRTIYVTAKKGSIGTTTTDGFFDMDVDANGRWSVEKFKGLMFHLEREANVIAKETRRGRGNIIICSADVASALTMAGVLDYTPKLNDTLEVDDTGNTFVGTLNGKYKVYIDPYAIGGNYFVMGYKGPGAFDAGLFYCPYVPLQMVRAVDPLSFQPAIGFKTRYGMVANPFAEGLTAGAGRLAVDSNVYYRRTIVSNIM